jgi:mRNA interferase RelE/StbE
MASRIEFAATAARELNNLDPQHRKPILKFLLERLAPVDNQRSLGQALRGSQLWELWKYALATAG